MSDASRELVTVVVPLYNKRSSVERAVRSVLHQTYTNLELQVIDDGSTDGSVEALQHIRDERVHIRAIGNRGPGAARNVGWKRGRGKIVAFLDADDFWHEDFLEWAVERLALDPDIAACTSGYQEIGTRGVRVPGEAHWRGRGLRPGRFVAERGMDPVRLLATLTYMFPVTTVVRRRVLDAFGGFFELERCTYGEDSFLWLQVLLNHPVLIDFTPLVTVDRTGSALSTLDTLHTRSIEPVLTHASAIRSVCPADLRELLDELLAHKAFKRACTLAAVGRWREGRSLRSRLEVPGAWRQPYGLASKLLANPVGAVVARAALSVLRRVRPH